jgi:hypothetical protein
VDGKGLFLLGEAAGFSRQRLTRCPRRWRLE